MIADCIDAICKLVEEKTRVGFGISSSQANSLEKMLSEFEDELVASQIFPSAWTHKHSIGKGNLASVMWVVFLPPGQTTQDGIYVSFCFGKAGNGLVTGCAISNTSQKKYSYIQTVKRPQPKVDVDGTRRGTHYNNGFVNPMEVLAGKVDEDTLLKHLKESVDKCEECLQLKPLFKNAPIESVKEDAMKLKLCGMKELSAINDQLLLRLITVLRTKPFAILAGHSGTGKSQLVRRLAYMTCNNRQLVQPDKNAPGNFCMIQVKPNWHDSTDLLGFYSEMNGRHFVNTPFVEFICKAYAYPETPFFVCLDEMNLAPVEQYFAEYLSALESMEKKGDDWITDSLLELDKEKDAAGNEKIAFNILRQIMRGAASSKAADWICKHGLTIPKNLFVIGTVNMDETTCQFSRKVLDRAMTLLMNDIKFVSMAASKKPSEEELLNDNGINFFLEGDVRGDIGKVESGLLEELNRPLCNTPFVVAYRFANEYALYEAALTKLEGVNLSEATDEDKKKWAAKALDHMVLMKLLPRIHGMKKTVRNIFYGHKVRTETGEKDIPGLKACLPTDGLSVDMMNRIIERDDDDYLTFWP